MSEAELAHAATTADNGDERQRQQPYPLRVFEFFSGIGGMRLALQNCLAENPSFEVSSCTAYECSHICNTCYAQVKRLSKSCKIAPILFCEIVFPNISENFLHALDCGLHNGSTTAPQRLRSRYQLEK
jgi:hypothetical protein